MKGREEDDEEEIQRKRLKLNEDEVLTSKETTPEKVPLMADVEWIKQKLAANAKFPLSQSLVQSLAEYLFTEKKCNLGEDPILLVHCLPALHEVVRR